MVEAQSNYIFSLNVKSEIVCMSYVNQLLNVLHKYSNEL